VGCRRPVKPQGRYRGEVLGVPGAGLVWKGKVFTDDTVTNLILGRELVEGRVAWDEEDLVWTITYPGGLVDRLVEAEDRQGGYWGVMKLGWFAVWFRLTPWA
jgi:hypothetical protein